MTSTPSLLRIVLVTALLSVLGAIVGGVLGAIVWALPLGLPSGTEFSMTTAGLSFGAAWGALFGVVLAPIAAWTLMRHVPLWRAIAETAAATLVGGAIGLDFEPRFGTGWLSAPILGIGGFMLAAVRLRFSRRARVAEIESHAVVELAEHYGR